MHSFVGASLPGVQSYPAQYTHDTFLEDLSRQMAVSASRRYSRGSNGAHTGTAMRVAKPSSASNSPRNSLMQQRRRTLMNDPAFIQRAQQVVEQPYLPTPGPDTCGNAYYEPVKKAPRPVSWHPSTMAQTQQYIPPVSTQQTQYPFPSYCEADCYAAAPAVAPAPVQFPPTPAAYSAYSSPASAFSPLNLPYSNYELPQTYCSPSWDVSAADATANLAPSTLGPAQYSFTPGPSCAPSLPSYVATSHSPANWASLAPQAPPTPEDPPKSQQPEPALQNDESIPFQSLDENDDEEDGDILIGLGLYDPPEKLPFHGDGGLLGASFDYQPTGKGLKLEDAWEPPVSDDDDDDEDGEGEAETADED